MCECIYFKVVNKIVFLNYQKLCTFFFESYVCVSHKIEIEIWCACCGAVLRPKVDSVVLAYCQAQNMPSSMVKYVSRKYLCANNRMRNEREISVRQHTFDECSSMLEHWQCETYSEIRYLCNQKNVHNSSVYLIHFLRLWRFCNPPSPPITRAMRPIFRA